MTKMKMTNFTPPHHTSYLAFRGENGEKKGNLAGKQVDRRKTVDRNSNDKKAGSQISCTPVMSCPTQSKEEQSCCNSFSEQPTTRNLEDQNSKLLHSVCVCVSVCVCMCVCVCAHACVHVHTYVFGERTHGRP